MSKQPSSYDVLTVENVNTEKSNLVHRFALWIRHFIENAE